MPSMPTSTPTGTAVLQSALQRELVREIVEFLASSDFEYKLEMGVVHPLVKTRWIDTTGTDVDLTLGTDVDHTLGTDVDTILLVGSRIVTDHVAQKFMPGTVVNLYLGYNPTIVPNDDTIHHVYVLSVQVSSPTLNFCDFIPEWRLNSRIQDTVYRLQRQINSVRMSLKELAEAVLPFYNGPRLTRFVESGQPIDTFLSPFDGVPTNNIRLTSAFQNIVISRNHHRPFNLICEASQADNRCCIFKTRLDLNLSENVTPRQNQPVAVFPWEEI